MATRDAIDADFNAVSRQILCKLEIFFESTPIVCSVDDLLIDFELLGELSAEGSNPLGDISTNEINFSLYNQNGIFSPTLVTGPYYGLIKKGVKIIPYFKPADKVDTINWKKMGEFFVSDWQAEITGIMAMVTATDKLQEIFDSPAVSIPLLPNITFHNLYDAVFTQMGYTATVDAGLDSIIPYGFIEGTPKEFLQQLSIGAVATCICDQNGNIIVEKLNKTKSLRATITDADQILKVKSTQSILKTYDGVELTYKLPQLAENVLLLEVQNISVPVGVFAQAHMAFSVGPVKAISEVLLVTTEGTSAVKSFTATPWGIDIVTSNTGASDLIGTLKVYGAAVSFVDTLLTDNTSAMLALTNKYVQTLTYAVMYKSLFNSFVSSDVPTLNVEIRGNPLYQLGEKLRLTSTKYGLDFYGVIQRLKYTYNGGLSCSMVLLNADIVEVG